MTTSLVSLNICGLSKLAINTSSREWLLSHDIVALQETLHLPQTLGFEGFSIVDEPAKEPQSSGPCYKRSGGIAILFANTWLGTAKLEVVFRDWSTLAVRVIPQDGKALLVVNVYVPLHSAGRPDHLDAVIKSRIDALTTQYANDATILCGDWNGDIFRLNQGRVVYTPSLSPLFTFSLPPLTSSFLSDFI
jgi:exonuclease III